MRVLSYTKSRRETDVKILRAIAIFGSVALLLSPLAKGTPEMAKKESKQCAYCHTAIGKPDLNDAGKYYKDHGSFDGYREKK